MTDPRPASGKRTSAAAALTALAALALSSCGTSVSPEAAPQGTAQEGYPVTVQNCGTELTFEAEPTRLVGLSPSQTELLVELGQADQLVGQAQTDTDELPAELSEQVADVPVLSDSAPPTRETLLEVTPDFVYSPTTYEFTTEQGFASTDQLAEAGANAYVATGGCPERRQSGTVDDVFTDIENLGMVFAEPERAAELAGEGQERLAAVSSAIEGAELPTVAQLYVDGTTLSAIGSGVEYDIILQAGGDNVFDPDESAFADFFAATITPEEVTSRDPDAIVFGVKDSEHEAAVRSYLTETFPDVTAVAEDRLIAVPGSDLFPGTLGNIGAVERIAEGLHPDRF
ncbi:ABC transporter substrate-binding protein [Nocardiopsis sp. NPDC058631]|uniref:ABC transporter substrate-binding protein n=1 Tax=Nocardiopsis sp. NPDC058631 TaxID=3346566 RepID=UPI00364C891A